MKLKYILPAAYFALASYAWIDFTNTNHDGLANIGLMLVVAPVTVAGLIVGWLIGEESFVLLPDGFGYLGGHAAYFFPSVLVVGAGLWWFGRWIDRRR